MKVNQLQQQVPAERHSSSAISSSTSQLKEGKAPTLLKGHDTPDMLRAGVAVSTPHTS